MTIRSPLLEEDEDEQINLYYNESNHETNNQDLPEESVKIKLSYESGSETEEDTSILSEITKKYGKQIKPIYPIDYQKLENTINKQKNKKIDESTYSNKVYRNEINFLEKYNFNCEKNWNIDEKFIYIDIRKLNEMLKNQFYNKNLLELNSCVINTLLYSKFTYMLFFSSIKSLNLNSLAKYETQLIASTNFKGYINDNLILKFDLNKECLHEVVCGLIVGNEMRKLIPTFVWTYGVTKCTSPIISKDGTEILTACNEDVKFPYSIPEEDNDNEYISVIIEKLEGLSLYEYIKQRKLSDAQLVSILLIVFSSISEANKRFGFVHNDLHDENIIMRPLTKYSCVKLPQLDIYVNTFDSIPIIFDFGFSTFELNGKKCGNWNYYELGIDPNNSNPMQDVIKLLMSIYKITNNNLVYDLLLLLFENKATINLIYDNYSILPNINKLIKYNIDEFIQIIISFVTKSQYSIKYEDIFVEKGTYPILNHNESDAIDIQEIKKTIFSKLNIDNLIDLNFYLKKHKLERKDLEKIILFLLYFTESYTSFIEKAPSNNLKPETIIQKFFKIKNHIDTGNYIIDLLSKTEEKYGFSDFNEIIEEIQKHIDKLIDILIKYKNMMIIKKDYYLSPKIMNKKIKNILMNEKYYY
jgi:hypothetical protein